MSPENSPRPILGPSIPTCIYIHQFWDNLYSRHYAPTISSSSLFSVGVLAKTNKKNQPWHLAVSIVELTRSPQTFLQDLRLFRLILLTKRLETPPALTWQELPFRRGKRRKTIGNLQKRRYHIWWWSGKRSSMTHLNFQKENGRRYWSARSSDCGTSSCWQGGLVVKLHSSHVIIECFPERSSNEDAYVQSKIGTTVPVYSETNNQLLTTSFIWKKQEKSALAASPDSWTHCLTS